MSLFIIFDRYFVLCIQDSGRKAYIGIGFADRADSFDLNVTLQDHFRGLRKEAEGPSEPSLDLALRDGQTIRIDIAKKTHEQTSRKAPGGSGMPLLPPPGEVEVAPAPPGINPPAAVGSRDDLWGDFAPSGNQAQPRGNWVQF